MALPKKNGIKKINKEAAPVEDVAPKVEAPAEQEDVSVPAVKVDEPMAYVDPAKFVYEIKAGRTIKGFSYTEVLDYINSMIGKEETITIKRKTPAQGE